MDALGEDRDARRIVDLIRSKSKIPQARPLRLTDRLTEELGFDSLSMIEFIVELEGLIGREVDDTDLTGERFESVESVIGLYDKYGRQPQLDGQ